MIHLVYLPNHERHLGIITSVVGREGLHIERDISHDKDERVTTKRTIRRRLPAPRNRRRWAGRKVEKESVKLPSASSRD